jgi:hypothetical protein
MERLIGALATLVPLAIFGAVAVLVVSGIVRHVSSTKSLRARTATRGFSAESES